MSMSRCNIPRPTFGARVIAMRLINGSHGTTGPPARGYTQFFPTVLFSGGREAPPPDRLAPASPLSSGWPLKF